MQSVKRSASPFWRIVCQISFVIVLGLFSASIASAQGAGGRVSGRATDPTGAIMPGVHVSAQNTKTNAVSATETDNSGYYLLQLPQETTLFPSAPQVLRLSSNKMSALPSAAT